MEDGRGGGRVQTSVLYCAFCKCRMSNEFPFSTSENVKFNLYFMFVLTF